jgi:hypothetical protein
MDLIDSYNDTELAGGRKSLSRTNVQHRHRRQAVAFNGIVQESERVVKRMRIVHLSVYTLFTKARSSRRMFSLKSTAIRCLATSPCQMVTSSASQTRISRNCANKHGICMHCRRLVMFYNVKRTTNRCRKSMTEIGLHTSALRPSTALQRPVRRTALSRCASGKPDPVYSTPQPPANRLPHGSTTLKGLRRP